MSKLITKIQTSTIEGKDNNDSKEIKNDIIKDLIESKKILNYFLEEYGEKSYKYQKILKEYKELQSITKNSLNDNIIDTQNELENIQKEFEDIKDLESYGDYLDRKKIELLNKAKEYKKRKVTEIAKELLKEGNIPDNKTIISVLDKIQYIVTGKEDQKIEKLINKLENGIEGDPILQLEASNIIGNFTGLIGNSIFNTIQEKLIENILGNNNFNEKYIKGYNSTTGNFIVEISDITEYIKETPIKEINSLLLANYIGYLTQNGGKLDIKSLIGIFGKNKLFELGELWDEDKSNNIAKKAILENGGKNIIKMIQMFSSPNIFLNNIGKLSTEEKEIAIQLLEQNMESIRDKFKNELTQSLRERHPHMSDKKINTIIDNLLKNLGKIYINKGLNFDKKLEQIYIQFGKLNKDWDIGLNIKEKTKETYQYQKFQNTKEYIENEIKISKTDNLQIKQKFKNRNKQLLIEGKEITAGDNLNNLIDNDTFSKIINGEINYNEYIIELKTQNNEFNKQFNEIKEAKLELQKQEKSNKIKEKKEKKVNFDINTKNIKIEINKYKDGSTFEYTKQGDIYNLVDGSKEGIDVTKEEFKIIKNNPEAKDNLFLFQKITDELNIDFVFKKRHEFIKLVKYLNPSVNIDLTGDYLNNAELVIILNTLITLTGNKKSNDADLESVTTKIREINNVNINENEKDNRGSPIEKILKNKGIIDINNPYNYFIKTKALESIPPKQKN